MNYNVLMFGNYGVCI